MWASRPLPWVTISAITLLSLSKPCSFLETGSIRIPIKMYMCRNTHFDEILWTGLGENPH